MDVFRFLLESTLFAAKEGCVCVRERQRGVLLRGTKASVWPCSLRSHGGLCFSPLTHPPACHMSYFLCFCSRSCAIKGCMRGMSGNAGEHIRIKKGRLLPVWAVGWWQQPGGSSLKGSISDSEQKLICSRAAGLSSPTVGSLAHEETVEKLCWGPAVHAGSEEDYQPLWTSPLAQTTTTTTTSQRAPAQFRSELVKRTFNSQH